MVTRDSPSDLDTVRSFEVEMRARFRFTAHARVDWSAVLDVMSLALSL
jgi:hypothetical protein